MLKSLTVWNFALLEHVTIEFDRGLNILTGETGAGKSILIDALGAILGQRVDKDSIRAGCDSLRLEAVFSFEKEEDALQELLKDQAIDTSEDTLIIMRQISRTGRNQILVNGCHVTLTTLKKIGAMLVDIHGQHSNLSLLKEAEQFALLDHADPEIAKALSSYAEAFRVLREKQKELEDKEKSAKDSSNRMDMLKWQMQEIEAAQLQEGEDDRLESEIKKLSHAEKIAEAAQLSDHLLNDDVRGALGILSALSTVKENLQQIHRYDDALANAEKIVDESMVSLQEAAYEIRDYAESMDFSPQRLDALQRRMDVIDKLRKKYGATVADILEYQEKIKKELLDIGNYDEDIRKMKDEIHQAEVLTEKRAAALTQLRRKAAEQMSREIVRQLKDLGMENARFVFSVDSAERFGPQGKDRLHLLFCANAGEELQDLSKTASGGELSRIALAIKTVDANRADTVPTMVFDEIDTGIGGRTAQRVAERIALIARYKQVLCITHLPQIACMADVHLYIMKHTVEKRTVTQVSRLSDAQQVTEIARMASGEAVSSSALDNAREMVTHAAAWKKQQERQK